MIEIKAYGNLAYVHIPTKTYIGKTLYLGKMRDLWNYELIFEKEKDAI